jgi:hypothetical protein
MHMIPMISRISPSIPIHTPGNQTLLMRPLPPPLPRPRDPLLPYPLSPHDILTLHLRAVFDDPLCNRFSRSGFLSAGCNHHVGGHAVAVVGGVAGGAVADTPDFADAAGEGGYDGFGAGEGGGFAAGGGGGDGGWGVSVWGGGGGHAAFEC